MNLSNKRRFKEALFAIVFGLILFVPVVALLVALATLTTLYPVFGYAAIFFVFAAVAGFLLRGE